MTLALAKSPLPRTARTILRRGTSTCATRCTELADIETVNGTEWNMCLEP